MRRISSDSPRKPEIAKSKVSIGIKPMISNTPSTTRLSFGDIKDGENGDLSCLSFAIETYGNNIQKQNIEIMINIFDLLQIIFEETQSFFRNLSNNIDLPKSSISLDHVMLLSAYNTKFSIQEMIESYEETRNTSQTDILTETVIFLSMSRRFLLNLTSKYQSF